MNLKDDLNKQAENFHKIGKDLDQKVENFETKMKLLQKALDEKDSEIIELKKQMLSIENTLETKTKELKTIIKKEQDKSDSMIKHIEKANKENKQKACDKLKCTLCGFTTTSKQGLKTHVKRKHSEIAKTTFPITCELCERELKQHIHQKISGQVEGG